MMTASRCFRCRTSSTRPWSDALVKALPRTKRPGRRLEPATWKDTAGLRRSGGLGRSVDERLDLLSQGVLGDSEASQIPVLRARVVAVRRERQARVVASPSDAHQPAPNKPEFSPSTSGVSDPHVAKARYRSSGDSDDDDDG
jgi:hypothetical protein